MGGKKKQIYVEILKAKGRPFKTGCGIKSLKQRRATHIRQEPTHHPPPTFNMHACVYRKYY